MINAIIVDDEEAGVENLTNLLKKYVPELKVVATACNITMAKELIAKLNPHLLFLDIEMPFGNGLDLIAGYDRIPFEVIFVTAFDKYALQAIRLSACDYILKPIDIQELVNAVGKVEERMALRQENLNLKQLLENVKGNSKSAKIALPTLQGMIFVKVADIIYCEAEGSYTWFHFSNRDKLLATKNLGEYEDILSGKGFIRVHHAHLVNTDHIIEFIRANSPVIVLSNGVNISVSQRKRDVLNTYIDSLNR